MGCSHLRYTNGATSARAAWHAMAARQMTIDLPKEQHHFLDSCPLKDLPKGCNSKRVSKEVCA
jgi:hypothetical protein